MALKFQPGDEVQVYFSSEWTDATVVHYIGYSTYRIKSPRFGIDMIGRPREYRWPTKNIRAAAIKICDTEEKLTRLLEKIR